MSNNTAQMEVTLAQVESALEQGTFDAMALRLPGAPNLSAIKNDHAFSKLAKARHMAQEAKRLQQEAIASITESLLEDWTHEQICQAATMRSQPACALGATFSQWGGREGHDYMEIHWPDKNPLQLILRPDEGELFGFIKIQQDAANHWKLLRTT